MSNLKLNKLLIHKTLGKVFKSFLLTLNSSKNKTNKNTKKKKNHFAITNFSDYTNIISNTRNSVNKGK